MTNIDADDSSSDESDVYYDSSDDEYIYIGDQQTNMRPHCACCNITINNSVSYLFCDNTNDYLCLRCFESAHITPEVADEYAPIWGQ